MDEFGNPLGGGAGLSFDPDSGYSAGGTFSDQVNVSPPTFSPSVVNPDASSYGDILRTGVSRLVDAVTDPATLSNTQPVQRPVTPVRQNTGQQPLIPQAPGSISVGGISLSIGTLLLLLVGGFAAWKLAR